MRLPQLFPPVLAVAIGAPLLSGQPQACDPNLVQPMANPIGYRLRGERCEGIYVQQVRGPSLVIASWTESFPDYDLTSPQPLVVEWDNAAGTGPVQVRAQALRRRLYYRMDAVRPPAATSFRWPSDVLAALKIPRTDVGVTAIARSGAERDLYLPVRVHQGAATPHRGAYKLVLVPGVELQELFVTLAAASGAMLKNGEPVGYGYYPAERPIEVPIGGLRAGGVYHLEIGATLKSGGASTAGFWFYHAAVQERAK